MYEFAVKDADGVFQVVFTGSMEEGVHHMNLCYPEVGDDFPIQVRELGKMN